MEQEIQELEAVKIEKMLKGMSSLTQEDRKIRNQTYQEHQLITIHNLKKKFVEELHHLYKQGIKSKFLNNIIQNHQRHFSCLLAFCSQIGQVIQESRVFTLSHKNYASQSALLAFFLAKQHSANVSLVVADESLLQMGHLIAGEAEDDKISFTKAALQKEGVSVLSLKEWRREGATFAADAFVVLDVFGLNPVEYSPFLLRSFAGMATAKRAFVYHSHLQDDEVAALLSQLSAEALPLRLWAEHPLECVLEREEGRVVEQLIDFLREDANHPQKQDSVVFFPVEQHVRHFSARLAEQLSKAGLKDCVSVIAKPHQPQLRSKNNIFVVEGTEQLQRWNYDYANVLYVIDYGKQVKFTYNYGLCSYEQQILSVSSNQKAKRYSLVGNTQFGIYTCLSQDKVLKQDSLDSVKDISFYILQMIDYGLAKYLDFANKRVSPALSLLQRLAIIKKQGTQFKIIDELSISYAKQGISPIEYRFISSFSNCKEAQKYMNLAISMSIFLHCKENIRKSKHESDHFMKSKSTQIWRKRGYIESCMAIIAQCQTSQIYLAKEGQGESFRRNSSKISESQTDPFGSFYQLIDGPNGQENEKLCIPTFLQQNLVNEQVLFAVREQIDHYREVLGVKKIAINVEKQDFDIIFKEYVSMFKQSLLFYSGSLRKGYLSDNVQLQNKYVQINNDSLKRQNYIKPLFISVLRYQIQQGNQQITIWNTVPETIYLEVQGGLPITEKVSKTQVEIEFHGISSLVFEKLWRNNGSQIFAFAEEHGCFIEPNHQMALIVIHCDEFRANKVKAQFQKKLERIKQNISGSNRLAHYLGNTKFYFGAGGNVKDMVVGQYINKGLLQNLHLQVTKQDLEELIQEFILVRDINVRLPQLGKQTKSAVIYFNSQRDYYAFYETFNQCQYYGLSLKVSPIKKSKIDHVWQRQYIEFIWFVWQTHNKALVRFTKQQAAKKAFQAFTNNPQFDGSKVQVTIDGRNLLINNLSDVTDQIFIEEALRNYGPIEQVQILKTPLKDLQTDKFELQNLIFQTTQNRQFRQQNIQKGKNGLRKCIVNFEKYEDLMKVVAQRNKTDCSRLGESRLYTIPHLERSMQVTETLRNAALSIIEQVFEQIKALNGGSQNLISYKVSGEQVIFHSSDLNKLNHTYAAVSNRMRGQNIKIKKAQKNLVFNELGLANLLDLEEKYNCKLIINIASQTLSVVCRKKVFDSLQKDILSRVSTSFFYKIYLNSKAYKHFKREPETLEAIKKKYGLKLVELEVDQQSIIIEGSIVNVQTANIYFMYLIESLNKPEEEQRVHSDVCGICCEEPKQSYRLQSCFHRFCIQCMQQYIRNVLGDRSQFPLKCPHCAQLIIIQDLNLLLDKAQWQKVETMGINKFVSDNGDKMSFCFTAGCKEINIYDGLVWSCKVCNFSYCNKCKEIVHPGYTCNQAIEIRQTDDYFLKYMFENGVRQCPNPNCKMPVSKIDGCNKVLCSRCGKSMCFKCKPNQMIPYDTPNLAYEHLNQVHGGYW